jgi:DNA-binding CsgD family transcriptional regulator
MITLSDLELAQLREVTRVCLTIENSSDEGSFFTLLVSTFRKLLAADRGLLVHVEREGEAKVFADGFSSSETEAYRKLFPRDHGANLVRARGLEVWSHTQLISPHPEVFFGTEIYNEYYRPVGLNDGIGYVVPWPDESMAILKLHNDRYGSASFGERGREILSLALPSFRASLWSRRHFARQWEDLAAMVDPLGVGVLFFDEGGKLLHRNRGINVLFKEDPHRKRIEQTARDVAMLTASNDRRSKSSEFRADSEAINVVTALSVYKLRAFRAGGETLSPRPTIVVVVERLSPRKPPPNELSDRYGLTPRECEILYKLMTTSGLTDIARELHISKSTLRHHTEHIYFKLNVHSRTELISFVLGT